MYINNNLAINSHSAPIFGASSSSKTLDNRNSDFQSNDIDLGSYELPLDSVDLANEEVIDDSTLANYFDAVAGVSAKQRRVLTFGSLVLGATMLALAYFAYENNNLVNENTDLRSQNNNCSQNNLFLPNCDEESSTVDIGPASKALETLYTRYTGNEIKDPNQTGIWKNCTIIDSPSLELVSNVTKHVAKQVVCFTRSFGLHGNKQLGVTTISTNIAQDNFTATQLPYTRASVTCTETTIFNQTDSGIIDRLEQCDGSKTSFINLSTGLGNGGRSQIAPHTSTFHGEYKSKESTTYSWKETTYPDAQSDATKPLEGLNQFF